MFNSAAGWGLKAAPGMAPPPILICLLGGFRLLKAGQLVPLRSGSKTEAVLAYLGLRADQCVARDALLQTVWPDSDLPRADHAFRNLLCTLQRQLRDALSDAPLIVHADGCYQLNTSVGVAVDVTRFDALVQLGDVQVKAGDPMGAETYREAIALYRGDLHVGDADLQAVLAREHLRAHYLALLLRLATYQLEHQAYHESIELLRRILYLDPGFEHAHRLLMRCYARLGQRSIALRHYDLCSDILESEFATKPEPETTDLFEQIRREPGSV